MSLHNCSWLHVALFEPEIPPNTGNIIRLCANTGAQLHLIHPLGFILDDRRLRRAGLDYHEWAPMREHISLTEFLSQLQPARLFAFTTKGRRCYDEVTYRSGDVLLFGPETRGLPSQVLTAIPEAQRLRIPMLSTQRSLNLSNAVAVAVYEAWRQLDFLGTNH
jgi:tRNA (cytidine/uridine-2'-O-)-methyltransferase